MMPAISKTVSSMTGAQKSREKQIILQIRSASSTEIEMIAELLKWIYQKHNLTICGVGHNTGRSAYLTVKINVNMAASMIVSNGLDTSP